MTEGRSLSDRFLLLQTIGAGGATEVWLAQDREIGELVALRLLATPLNHRWEALRDACREARRLAHPHITRVFDFHRHEDTRFLSREYLQGVDASWLTGQPLPQVVFGSKSIYAGEVLVDIRVPKVRSYENGNPHWDVPQNLSKIWWNYVAGHCRSPSFSRLAPLA